VTFPDVETTAPSPVNLTRQKRQLADQAIAQATAAQWAEAAATNRRLLELGPDAESENRLAKALWEQGELGSAREHYQTALALDPTNRIAERNIDRLKMLMLAAGEPPPKGGQGPVQHLRRGDRQDRLRSTSHPPTRASSPR
jgi:tetratricopeptide (TPR) repeat protein